MIVCVWFDRCDWFCLDGRQTLALAKRKHSVHMLDELHRFAHEQVDVVLERFIRCVLQQLELWARFELFQLNFHRGRARVFVVVVESCAHPVTILVAQTVEQMA